MPCRTGNRRQDLSPRLFCTLKLATPCNCLPRRKTKSYNHLSLGIKKHQINDNITLDYSHSSQKSSRIDLMTRIQLASATGGLIPKNTWFGVLNPRHFLGRLLSLSITLRTSVSVTSVRSIPFGKNCRIIPL